jgi:hypothetical protein
VIRDDLKSTTGADPPAHSRTGCPGFQSPRSGRAVVDSSDFTALYPRSAVGASGSDDRWLRFTRPNNLRLSGNVFRTVMPKMAAGGNSEWSN